MIYAVIIPALLLFVPWVLVRYVFVTKRTRDLNYRSNAEYLWLAAAIWVLSQLLPRVSIYGQTDTFIMHTLGGAVAAILYVYTLKAYRVEFEAKWQLWVGLFLFVSALGVLNELFEFFLYSIGVPGVVGGDEWWDLTANTLGSFASFVVLKLFNKRV